MTKQSRWFMWKKGYRSIIKNKGKTIPIILLMTLSIGFGIAMFNFVNVRMSVVEELVEITNFADGTIYLDATNLDVLDSILENFKEDYFEQYENRLILPIEFEIKDNNFNGLIVGLDTSVSNLVRINAQVDQNKNKLEVIEYCLNYEFAKVHGVEAGEEITIIYGSTEKQSQVKNIGYNLEYTFVQLRKDLMIPSVDPFPVLYVPLEYLISDLLGIQDTIANQILYKLKDNISQKELEDKLELELGGSLNSIIPQDEHPFITYMRESDESMVSMVLMFVLVFMIGAIFVLMVVLHRFINSDLKYIAVFQGLGATKKEIIGSYLIFNSIIFTISFVLGGLLGYAMGFPFNMFQSTVFHLPFMTEVRFGFDILLIFSIPLLVLSLMTTYLVCRKNFTMDVQQSLKRDTKYLEKPSLMEKWITHLKKNLHPYTKYTIRKIFGKKIFLLLLLGGIILSSALMIYTLCLLDSFRFSLDRKFSYVERWDGMANTWQFETRQTLDKNFENIKGLEIIEYGIIEEVFFSLNNTDFDDFVHICAYFENSELHILESENNKVIQNQEDVIISKELSLDYSIDIGSNLYIKEPISNKTFTLSVIDISNEMTEPTIFMSLQTAQLVLDKSNKYNVIYFSIQEGEDQEVVAKNILDLDIVQNSELKSAIEESLVLITDLMNMFNIVIGGMFGVFGLAVIAILVKNIIDYRIDEYAQMKAVGIKDLEIQKSILVELLIYFSISLPIGLVVGNILISLSMEQWTEMMPGLYYHIYPESYIVFIISILLIVLLVLFIQFRRINKLNLREKLQANVFG